MPPVRTSSGGPQSARANLERARRSRAAPCSESPPPEGKPTSQPNSSRQPQKRNKSRKNAPESLRRRGRGVYRQRPSRSSRSGCRTGIAKWPLEGQRNLPCETPSVPSVKSAAHLDSGAPLSGGLHAFFRRPRHVRVNLDTNKTAPFQVRGDACRTAAGKRIENSCALRRENADKAPKQVNRFCASCPCGSRRFLAGVTAPRKRTGSMTDDCGRSDMFPSGPNCARTFSSRGVCDMTIIPHSVNEARRISDPVRLN